ncbi:claudin-4-like [Pelmatolapia mariae]|uniref:claudin-4-like n=1 Tax=Pelmatolapia mariae TaxID=158779 RepID=UPI002FE5CA72
MAISIKGFIASIAICFYPHWIIKPSTTGKAIFMTLWKMCEGIESTQCTEYENTPPYLHLARALVIIAIIFGVFGILLAIAGQFKSGPEERQNRKMTVASGVAFLIAGICVMLLVWWIDKNIKGNSDNPPQLPESEKMVKGPGFYIASVTAGLLFLGGIIICHSFCQKTGN